MKKNIIYIGCLLIYMFSSCNDYLDKGPLDEFTDDKYWRNENSLRAYAQDFYSTYFIGYGQDYRVFGGYFSGDSYNDDFLITSPEEQDRANRFYLPTTNTSGPNTKAVWETQYKTIRKANVMLERVPNMNITDQEKAHWMGIAYFFRAVAYSALVKEYGEVPYIDKALAPTDKEQLYKDKDSRLFIVDHILSDFETALAGVRSNDGKLQVNKYVVGAFMSRWMLFHGTWLKYHGTTVGTTSKPVDNVILKKYFEGAIQGARAVVDPNKFTIADTYNSLFTSLSLAGNPEIIFYREYAEGVSINMLMEYNAKGEQALGGATKAAIESYLCDDGLPISQSPKYLGTTDPSIQNSFKNRDPRIYDTFVDSLRILNSKIHLAASATGYASKKFLNEQWLAENSPYVANSKSPADAPVIRYAEVLLNLVEARYEVSKVGGTPFTQADLDETINKIRARKLTKWAEKPAVMRTMPKLSVNGDNAVVNGVTIVDPNRDPSVTGILWEIRRERRIELMMEGRRSEDLNRWAKYEYIDSGVKGALKDAVLGAWIKKSDYPGIAENTTDSKGNFIQGVNLYNPTGNPAVEGYIIYYYYPENNAAPRRFMKGDITSERAYLRAVPVSQINDYKIAGYTLSQNPGWE